MKILMLSWEYPPRIVGGISRHLEGLSEALVRKGHEVHVITADFPGSPIDERLRGVNIHRVEVQIPAPNFHAWILLLNHFFVKKVAELIHNLRHMDIIHVHDWLATVAGVELKHSFGEPLVATLHSLEFRRSGGLDSPESRMIDSIEWWSTYESNPIIVCSGSMKNDIVNKFKVPESKIWVIPNGIDARRLEGKVDRDVIRSRYGVSPEERLVLFVGRLTFQKGCEYLIRAVPLLVSKHNIRLIIVGDGWSKDGLEREANSTGQSWRIKFMGYLPDDEVFSLIKAADVLVVPSVYEPFGVVALEGMAAGTPIVASHVDGLAEVIKHDFNGVLTYPRDPLSIAWGVDKVLSDRGFREWIVSNARKDVEAKYSWDAVADTTVRAYEKALEGG